VRIVSRYLLREFAVASTAVFLALIVTWVAADTLLHIERLTGDAGSALRGVLLASLDLIPLGVPMSCVAGAVWSFTRAVKSREITAIRCGGIPLRRTLVPVLLACIAIAAGLAVIQDRLLIPTRRALHEARMIEESGGRNAPQRILGRWWYADGESIFSASNFDTRIGLLTDVTIFLLDGGGRIAQRIEAETAENTRGGSWRFRNARIFEFHRDGALEQRYALQMELELGLSGVDLARAQRPPEMATLHGLWGSIRRTPAETADLESLQVAFHSRLVQPAAVLILVLLAIPFAIGDTERGDSLPKALLLALGSAAIYWTAWALGLLVGRAGVMPAFLPVWAVAATGLGIGGWRFHALKE
jgi:lipopolysaccharide export system permease protein